MADKQRTPAPADTQPAPSLPIEQLAYAAYGESTGGKNFQGNPMPTWDQLPEPIKAAWVAAAQAVASADSHVADLERRVVKMSNAMIQFVQAEAILDQAKVPTVDDKGNPLLMRDRIDYLIKDSYLRGIDQGSH